MNKKTIGRIQYSERTVHELLLAAKGEHPFSWGHTERQAKMYLLRRLGFVLVSKSKLEKGGHELKRGAKPLGKAYYKAPLKLYADLYLLGVQTRRTLKWHDLYNKGKALIEDGTYGKTFRGLLSPENKRSGHDS